MSKTITANITTMTGIKIPEAMPQRLIAIRRAIKYGQCEVIGQTTSAARWGDPVGVIYDVIQDNYWQRLYHLPGGLIGRASK